MNNTQYPHPVIADRIEEVMLDNGLIDKDLAKAIGQERKSILYYRNCVSNPSIQCLRYICKRYNISADWLLDIEPDADKYRRIEPTWTDWK